MILVSTTSTLPGYAIDEVCGIVTGHVVAGANVFKDFKGKMTDFFGGRSSTYERVLEKYEREAVNIMVQKAGEINANAILGISFDFEVMSFDGQMLMISCNGTAMKIHKIGGGGNLTPTPEQVDNSPSPPSQDRGTSVQAQSPSQARTGSGGVAQSDRYRRDVDAELRERLDE